MELGDSSSRAAGTLGFEVRSLSTPRNIWPTTQVSNSGNFQPPIAQATFTCLRYPRIFFVILLTHPQKAVLWKNMMLAPPVKVSWGESGWEMLSWNLHVVFIFTFGV